MRIEQGIPNIVKKRTRAEQEKELRSLSEKTFRDMIQAAAEEAELRRKTVKLLEKQNEFLEQIINKLEEVRYGIADNETGVSNLLKQMKITNSRLDELIDKRGPSFDKD